MIAIIDYGMGNIHSVNKALQVSGAKTLITNKAEDIKSCDKAVLPGVGAFDDAVLELKKQNLIEPILEHVRNGKPFLGICLGMQLLFDESAEAKKEKGLGILKGKVKKFKHSHDLKVPHMGWNQLKIIGACPLLRDVPENSFVYFCHSYYPDPLDKGVIAALTNYGQDFAAIVWKEKIFGMQFHPEKSQSIGLKMMENFVNLC
ncbi:MAG: imidazole glycerol phosphate synthase subunit HisH [Candidatus Omnitrophica bacterium]|nr:imidazole glycerol phosphate synthase subunit HisH [Candidatus Omnitrophota bacterium]